LIHLESHLHSHSYKVGIDECNLGEYMR